MKKSTAIELLGGTVPKAARLLDCSHQALYKWPDDRPLSRPMADRVLAACVRMRADKLRERGRKLHPLEEDAVEL